jgi:hypothetical protein
MQTREFMRHPFSHFRRMKVMGSILQLDFGEAEASTIELYTEDAQAISLVLQTLASAAIGPVDRTRTGSLWTGRDRRSGAPPSPTGLSSGGGGGGSGGQARSAASAAAARVPQRILVNGN